MKLDIINLGMMNYEDALNYQIQLINERLRNEINDTLILVEHPPVITMSKRAKDSQIKIDRELLLKQGVTICPTNRGGEITFHGPGQLVGYIILDLKNHSKDLKRLVFNLEEIFIQLLKNEYHIDSDRDLQHRGVWVDDDKIMAIGLAIKRGITMHGFSLNVNIELNYADWIIPCGIQDKGIISLKKLLGHSLDMKQICPQVIHYFCKIFGYNESIVNIRGNCKNIIFIND